MGEWSEADEATRLKRSSRRPSESPQYPDTLAGLKVEPGGAKPLLEPGALAHTLFTTPGCPGTLFEAGEGAASQEQVELW
ncbi:hypothetical protein NDU88_008847 [Pleurodeles waltl]|uniref:Uncharacterized protein n=1 Tax=Pleurodeles waltl TaxID=8319 RepID=A0AAV7PU43_PLEWA|nr:hypothetical protein NDU88_008847 [Pleurodeles waltl]